ncbi:MAG: general negative regulator of transcription subunit 5 [Peltula sp. TS41687]|nr:MAG: general negative regulator of transcription subunit 5 [Peltula sp. TS41687]
MAQRKLQQEIDKTFKRIAEGVQAFEAVFDKIQQTSNSSQKEKLEDALKREIKKLQRHRDQIKTWAASNEIKDKKPLLEQRKLIETQMEKFKAVEKEMKTKAYSKEGLSAAAKLDPKEKEKVEACQFLSSMIDELERQIETMEVEGESLQANLKKGKKDTLKAGRVAEIEQFTERHKWHQAKLELVLRALENGSVEADQVMDLAESIKYYVENHAEADFAEDDTLYDDLHLDEEEDLFGMNNELDRVSSQDAQSIQEDMPETDSKAPAGVTGKQRAPSGPELPGVAARRASTHVRSPLPALATLHTPFPSTSSTIPAPTNMKPAPPPTRPPGEILKYASAAAAAAAAAASDKNGVGIAPLPPPASAAPSTTQALPGQPPLPGVTGVKASAAESPRAESSKVAEVSHPGQKVPPPASVTTHTQGIRAPSPADLPTQSTVPAETGVAGSAVRGIVTQSASEHKSASKRAEPVRMPAPRPNAENTPPSYPAEDLQDQERTTMDAGSSFQNQGSSTEPQAEDAGLQESIYHLPPGLQDLLQSFEATKNRVTQPSDPSMQRLLAISHSRRPDSSDADKPRRYRPQTRFKSPSYYPQEPLPLLDDPRLYARIDTDTLFYVFYYRQATYQQHMAAKALKSQSWRFHKQYQTWFQRHEEPKTITEEFEQGTYRFFDYESTWMNRRKAEFKFAYKFLEDDI